jgi:hypothetical protein
MSKENMVLQLFYAGVLADSVSHYEQAGILDDVTEKKLKQQQIAAPAQLKQLDIKSVQQLFEKFSEIFGCIQWETYIEKDMVIATGNSCLLCKIAKTMKTAQPCYLYCINPIKSLLMALNPAYSFIIKETLWDGEKCEFNLTQDNK